MTRNTLTLGFYCGSKKLTTMFSLKNDVMALRLNYYFYNGGDIFLSPPDKLPSLSFGFVESPNGDTSYRDSGRKGLFYGHR